MNLTPYGHIEPQSWMTDDSVNKIFAVLGRAENDFPAALFVGGCVRNAVLKKNIADIDIATILKPDAVMEKLKSAGIKALPTGIDHGTVTAVIGKESFEITTLRRDVSTDGRRAVVAFTGNWEEDAKRRDFTMNTLLMDQDGNIYDPTGQGLDDLKAGRVRFVGDARQRVQEDYLRILRFFRFYAAYGKGAPDAEALSACREFAGDIRRLSKERVTQEFRRILMGDDAAPILELIFENNVLSGLLADGADLSLLQNDLSYAARLLVLAGINVEEIDRMEQWLVFSNAQKREIKAIAKAFFSFCHSVSFPCHSERSEESQKPVKKEILRFTQDDDKGIDEKAAKVLIYRYGHEIAAQAFLLCGYDGSALKGWDVPVFPLSGDDIIKTAGIEQGADIGRILREVEEWWIEQDFQPDRDECLRKL